METSKGSDNSTNAVDSSVKEKEEEEEEEEFEDAECDRCDICIDGFVRQDRSCCSLLICKDCLFRYVSLQISEGNIRLICPGTNCSHSISAEEIRQILDVDQRIKMRFEQFLVDAENSGNCRTCPRCNLITDVIFHESRPRLLRCLLWFRPNHKNKNKTKEPKNSEVPTIKKSHPRIRCRECDLEWCFECHAPWHQNRTCRQFKGEDFNMDLWSEGVAEKGERNAYRCPKCRVFIQRNDGCNHMTCPRCRVEFCYCCGRRQCPQMHAIPEIQHQLQFPHEFQPLFPPEFHRRIQHQFQPRLQPPLQPRLHPRRQPRFKHYFEAFIGVLVILAVCICFDPIFFGRGRLRHIFGLTLMSFIAGGVAIGVCLLLKAVVFYLISSIFGLLHLVFFVFIPHIVCVATVCFSLYLFLSRTVLRIPTNS